MTPTQLRTWRRKTFKSVDDAAAFYGVTRRAWYYWESGERKVPHWLGYKRVRRRPK